MISVKCDVCGDNIFSSAEMSDSIYNKYQAIPHDFLHHEFSHVCDKCKAVFEDLDIKRFLRNVILAKRKDIPWEDMSECDA